MAITFYATNNFTGDGTTVNWNINFADGYIDTTNVKARYLDNTGSYVDIAISSVAGNVVTISPAVANGQEFQIYRDTEKRFPLVDFSDGAILNETNLDTLATQAVMVSAEAFDQSNNGVRIAGDSLVIAQGIDAKAQLALDNADAAVATANAIDGKAQTALDNAAAAVATANAATSTAAGAVATANTALSTANDAADDAATAITTANGAVTTANAATTTANAASAAASAATTTANNAANDAATAVSTAGTALSTANTASTNASTAVSTANDAKATAEGIEAKADSALAASATAVSTANSAEATANAIDGKATDALDTADSAVATANTASTKADNATSTANSAVATANAIDAKAQTALDNTAALDTATMKKAANLSDITDKAAAWLNVRPIGSTPLSSDPTGPLDATTRQWVESLRSVQDTWSVIDVDTVLPTSGTTVSGGKVISEYNAGNLSYATAELSASRVSGDTKASAKITASAYDPVTGTVTGTAALSVYSDGLITAHRVQTPGGYSVVGAMYPRMEWLPNNAHPDASGGLSIIEVLIGPSSTDVSSISFTRLRKDGSGTGRIDVAVPKTSGTLALQGTSGIAYKKDIVDADAQEALGRILNQRLVNFVYIDDEQERVRFGVIAEEAEVVAPQYIKHNDESYEDVLDAEGNKVGALTRDRPSVDTNPIVMDLMGCVQALHAKIAALEARIDELTSQ